MFRHVSIVSSTYLVVPERDKPVADSLSQSCHGILQKFLIEHQISTILGPVVQSIVSLTSSLRGQLVKCFMTL